MMDVIVPFPARPGFDAASHEAREASAGQVLDREASERRPVAAADSWRSGAGKPERGGAEGDDREDGNVSAALVVVGGVAMWLVILWFGIPALCRVIQWGGGFVGGLL